MSGALLILVLLAVAAVFATLLMGFLNMARGTSPRTSQKLMQWRVGLQFVALIIILLAIWMAQ
jgi:ABC-type Na+ efflux pump permease subunit